MQYKIPFKVIKTPEEYVGALLEKEESFGGPLCFASSFISSIYFSEDAIRRFYAGGPGDHGAACATLLRRRQLARLRGDRTARREVYEAAAFTKFLADGTVHVQDSAYRNRPSEIESVVTEILHWVHERQTLRIAVTTEVLPIVFAIYSPADTVVDIRTNYLYQRIQGFEIKSTGATAAFQEEFERLWDEAITQMSTDDVMSLLAANLQQWREGSQIDLSQWPRMRQTDRAID